MRLAQEFNFTEVKWNEIHEEVFKVNPELSIRCQQIASNKNFSLFKINYPYGASIIKKGILHIPTITGGLVPISDPRVPEHLRSKLLYSHIPLALILNSSSEVFIKIQSRVVSLNILNPGELFGLFEVMNLLNGNISDIPIWNVSAGARSTFMIPSIFDIVGYNRIKKRTGKDINIPSSLSDHWQTFVDINNSFDHFWHNTILLFSSDWFTEKNTIEYYNFYQYLVRESWKQFNLLEQLTDFRILWSWFTHLMNQRNLKPRAYLIDTIKHLILISRGFAIAFKPSVDDRALPMKLIQQTYIDEYNLKEYIPNIMEPVKFNYDSKVYYSLSFPTLFDSSPYFRNPPSLIEDQREIKRLLDILIKTVDQIENQTLRFLKNIKFELFHSSLDPYSQVLSSSMIVKEDKRFLKTSSIRNKFFCSSSSFFNGCIRISKNENLE